ncbi:hypothetical protein DAEQUDRAFT_305275 [Daedalea quercina L-15889]|uniref:C3H1-type domain-containing protein n=1 Tax=Daedalea quercina L-15889 TaxID=1314783 RepID=A0A165Q1E4_9APHY|nr:hypothetical protein DAEQUDRAFT_305275 [Daedalea quercina L-15889]
MATKTRTLKAGGATRAKRPEASTANLVVCASVPRGAEDGKNAKRELLQRNVKACSAPTSAAAAMTGTPSPLDQKAKAAPTPTADKVSASPSRGPSKRVTYTSNSSKAGKSERAPSESMHKDTLCSRKKGEDDPTQKLMPPDGKTTADKTHTVEKRSARCNVPSSDAATSAVSNTDSNSAPSVSGTGGPGVQKRPADTDATPLKRSSWPCKSWDANGYCPKGDACHRRHRKLVVPNGSSVSGESPATAKQAVAHSGGDPRQHAPPSSQALQADQAKLNVEDPTKVSSGDRLEQTPVQPLSDHERSANNSPEVVSASKCADCI